MMLGYLLARAGVSIVVIEKHADFLRDFRGDTVHPSTLEVMAELGLLEDLLRIPHHDISELRLWSGDDQTTVADFRHLPTQCKFMTVMPQWDFLQFLSERARALPTFRLLMHTEVTDVIRRDGRVVGVHANAADGPLEVSARLVVGCDGRDSVVRARADLPFKSLGSPVDVLWFRLTRRADDPPEAIVRVGPGCVLVLIGRPGYWQCGYTYAHGELDALRERGVAALGAEVGALVPFLSDRVTELRSFDDAPALTVRVNRLTRWYDPGVLCIGDAAHAMSPIGGIGINLAIQDAVAAARILAPPLTAGAVPLSELRRVQRRRATPARLAQSVQVAIANRVLGPVVTESRPPPGWVAPMLRRVPRLTRAWARFIGLGLRPEHVTV